MLIALKCAIIAWVYVNILTRPENILGWWSKLLHKLFVKETFVPAYSLREHWILKPILTCEKCVAGQIAFWYCIITGKQDVFDSVAMIMTAILFTQLISGIFKTLYK